MRYWMDLACQSLASAQREQTAGALHFAINRAYYACFYASSAVLLRMGRSFAKHKGVRVATHQHLVRSGQLSQELGRLYDELFAKRQLGDYEALVSFDEGEVAQLLEGAGRFVDAVARLL